MQLRERFEEAVGDAQAEAAQRPQPLRAAVVRDHRRARLRQDDGAGQFRPALSRSSSASGKGALRGVGGTRNCDWWFTDEAVFLDTAGRYTTQDSDAASDSAGWSEFLALLRKYRTRRPVNGVILTISAQDLMTQGAAGARGARRGGAPPARRAERGAADPAAGLPDGDQVRPGRRLHRVLRRPDAGRARAGLGRDVPLRADASQGEARRGVPGGVRRADRRA